MAEMAEGLEGAGKMADAPEGARKTVEKDVERQDPRKKETHRDRVRPPMLLAYDNDGNDGLWHQVEGAEPYVERDDQVEGEWYGECTLYWKYRLPNMVLNSLSLHVFLDGMEKGLHLKYHAAAGWYGGYHIEFNNLHNGDDVDYFFVLCPGSSLLYEDKLGHKHEVAINTESEMELSDYPEHNFKNNDTFYTTNNTFLLFKNCCDAKDPTHSLPSIHLREKRSRTA
tara:strand:- start:380 stop:1057 length:678 start_codon:yes stop_codon:yes gene_type:complete